MDVNNNVKNHKKIIKYLDWFIHMIGYGIILIIVSSIFKNTIQIDSSNFGIWCLLAAIIIYILNKTIKPFLVWLTLPITGLTLGLFYPFINVMILYIVNLILKGHFKISGIFMAFIVAVMISIMNILMEQCIIIPLLKRKEG